MRTRVITAVAVAALALPAVAQGEPNRFQLETNVAPGRTTKVTLTTVPRGQLSIDLTAIMPSTPGLSLTVQRGTGPLSLLVAVPGNVPSGTCTLSSSVLTCLNMLVTVPLGLRSWVFRLSNSGTATVTANLRIRLTPAVNRR
jgi:hypothetical protein